MLGPEERKEVVKIWETKMQVLGEHGGLQAWRRAQLFPKLGKCLAEGHMKPDCPFLKKEAAGG